MQKEVIGNHVLYCGDCQEILPTLADKSINHILSDPPYKYLDIDWDSKDSFDEDIVFDNFIRLLSDKGFVILFGRGTSFYRWNVKLAERGLTFKEEVIWNKIRATPTLPLLRIHELLTIHSKKGGSVKRVRAPYIENSKYDLDRIIGDLKKLLTALNNPQELKYLLEYLENKNLSYSKKNRKCQNWEVTLASPLKDSPRIQTALRAVVEGNNEMSIIKENREVGLKVYHPTQKPVRLIERLLKITSSEGDIVLDCFMGSGSTGVACQKTGRKFIGIEKVREYFEIACERLQKECNQGNLELKAGQG